MRLHRTFVIIASALSVAVVVVLTETVVNGQSAGSAATGDRRSTSENQVQRQIFDVMRGGGGRLGVTVKDLAAADVTRLKLTGPHGVVVDEVEKDSAAAKAGLKSGDVIIQFDGETVRSAEQFARLVRETPAGRAAKIGVMRDGKRTDLEATLDESAGAFRFDRGELVMPEIQGLRETPNLDALRENLNRWRDRTPGAPAEPGPRGNLYYFRTPGGPFERDAPNARGRLGVTVQDLTPELSAFFGVKDGVLVASVSPDSPAAKAGIKVGDVITTVNDKAVTGTDELISALADKDGDVTVGVVRDKKALSFKATLEGRALRPRQPVRRTPV